MSTWYRKDAEGWLLAIHAQPGAKRTAVAGPHGISLKIRIGAPPVDGKGNEALVEFIANILGVPKRAVSVVKGELSRQKLVRVSDPGADPRRLCAPQS